MAKNGLFRPVHDFEIELNNDNYNYIPEKMEIIGNVSDNTGLIIHGKIVGDIWTSAEVIVAPSAEISGSVSAKLVLCYGKIFGIVSASSWIYLKTDSVVSGDIYAVDLICENGVDLSGKVILSDHKNASGKKKPNVSGKLKPVFTNDKNNGADKTTPDKKSKSESKDKHNKSPFRLYDDKNDSANTTSNDLSENPDNTDSNIGKGSGIW